MKKRLLFVLVSIGISVLSNAQNYRMKVTMKDGSTTVFQASEVKDVTFDDNGSTDTAAVEYVEVAGIKWAKGNLRYVHGEWTVADCQWASTQYVSGNTDQTLKADYQNSEYFSWGIVGKDAVEGSWCNVPGIDLTKFYSDGEATVETEDFDAAECGDLAKWATRGSYRMPTKNEFDQLVAQASQQYGYVTTPEGNQVYGFLFTNPAGDVEQNLEPREISLAELETGLFLPAAGLGYYDNITPAGRSGYYWSSTPIEGTTNGRDAYELDFSADEVGVSRTLRSLRCAIRPVVNGQSDTSQDTYVNMTVDDLNALTSDRSCVNLTINDVPATITYIYNNDVYMRCGDSAIRLSSTGLENVVSKGEVCIGTVKGDFKLIDGMPVLVGNDSTEASLTNFMHFPGGSEVGPTDATLGEIVDSQHRCDLIQLTGITLVENEYGIVYTESGDTQVMIADGFGVNAMPATIDANAKYVVEGIFASGNPFMIYPTKTVAYIPDEAENLAAFKQIPDGASTRVKLTDARVTYVFRPFGETYSYVRDASGAACFRNFNLGFDDEGKTLNGTLAAKYSERCIETTDSTNGDSLTIAAGEVPQPIEKKLGDITVNDVDELITVKGVKIVDSGTGYYRLATTEGSSDVFVSNGFYLNGNLFDSLDADSTYDITGILSSDNGMTIKLTQWFTKSK